jgi:RNA polymerase sigma-70 factor (ECF subfamily)
MAEREWLAEQFEAKRVHLRGVAYRMLGSLTEAEDAVQETWLRVSRADPHGVENIGGWLTTIAARVCLDMLRSRKSRREEPLDVRDTRRVHATANPEQEAALADSIGLALLVVLDTLAPAERLAFVLHDMFAMSFDEIAGVVGRSPAAARQLASRARRRVRGAARTSAREVARQRAVVDRFLAALRAGDLEALIAVLDPDVVVRADAAAATPGVPAEIRGARAWASGAIAAARGARAARPALVDGGVGLVVAPGGRLFRVLRFAIEGSRITEIDVIGDPARLRALALGVLD